MTETYEPDDQIRARLASLDAIRELGVDPFPTRYARTHYSREVVARADELEGQTVRVAGRIVGAIRRMGKAGFAHLLDGGGRIQVHFGRETLGEDGWVLYGHLHAGDFIGVEGPVFRTRTGEVTIEAKQLTFLAKAIRPLPEKWHGLTDVEKRHRQRYLDLIVNDEVRQTIITRSRVVQAIRRFLDEREFIEVETPVLQEVAAGATARPFVTRSNALDQEMFLRIALELYLKRCIVGGLERVYEIGRTFRNEGLDHKHNPEFTMMELYQAYADYEDMMELVEQMVATVAREVLGTTQLTWQDQPIDVAPPWPRRTLRELILEHTGVDYEAHVDDADLRRAAEATGMKVERQWDRAKIIDELMTEFVEPKLIAPIFVMDHPVETTPLAKRRHDRPNAVYRFEPYIGGMELGNAYSELNDPVDQRRRFEEQAALRAAGDEEAQPLDEDFLQAIEHGMPPTGGLGIGIDRLVMILANQPSMREVILFPQLRSRSD
ncbi:MAG: lysyl-tRNA synthetase, class [Chloroflexota bacterium]|nr:lysyl-tRNA synthetase, class [Chloroflexota bacterium]